MWQDAHGDTLVETAQANGVLDWQWSHYPWGVVLEPLFRDSRTGTGSARCRPSGRRWTPYPTRSAGC